MYFFLWEQDVVKSSEEFENGFLLQRVGGDLTSLMF